MFLYEWAGRWGIPEEALEDLKVTLGVDSGVSPVKNMSEAAIQQRTKLNHCNTGGRLWRNNSGAFYDDQNRLVRYGLGNDSRRMNKHIKSSDLIGITPRVVNGVQVGIFTATEVKKGNWKFSGTKEEVAQLRFLLLVASMGGIGKFENGRGL